MDKPLWFDHFEYTYNTLIAFGFDDEDAWEAARQVADQAVADEEPMFMDAAVDAAKEVF